MRKLWKGVLLGAAVGGAVKVAQEMRGDGPIEEVGPAVAKAAAEAAVAGAVVGLILDRRDRRKRSRLQAMKTKAGLGSVVAGAGALADAALPAIHAAAEAARDKSVKAAEVAKPHVLAAAEVAREKSTEAVHAARPHVEHAADVAKHRAEKAAKAAKPHLDKATSTAKAKLAERDWPVVVAV